MSQILMLKGYNNYQNRILKKENTVQDYINAVEEGCYAIRTNINFNKRDGVAAQVIYNYSAVDALQDNMNYVVVLDNSGNIESRYFVMEATYQRNGQIILSLKRDVVADFYDYIIDAPAFIEKATLQDSDPMIFNSEGFAFNQIKTDAEILLKDATQTPWIVGYIAPKAESEQDKIIKGMYSHDVDFFTSDINSWNSSFMNKNILIVDPSKHSFDFVAEGDVLYNYAHKYSVTLDRSVTHSSLGRKPNTYKYRENGTQAEVSKALANAMKGSYLTDVGNYLYSVIPESLSGFVTQSEYNVIYSNYNNKIVQDTSTNKKYRVHFVLHTINKAAWSITSTSSSAAAVYSDMRTMANAAFRAGSGSTEGFELSYSGYFMSPYFEEVATSDLTIFGTVKTIRKQLADAPYCMFAIPYLPTSVRLADGTNIISDTDSALAFARCISAFGGDYCYDVQLLPYCPRIGLWKNDKIDLTESSLIEGRDYTYYGSKNPDQDSIETILGAIIWCTESEFNTGVEVNLSGGSTALEKKIKSETEMYRLCSPNYAAAYEFNAAKNNGVTYVDIDCAYKPYNPYIHANPVFGGIYGSDTNDIRGLVCQGDFSLPQSSEQWKQYELNNKNYQVSFDRQIENMDVMHKYDRVNNIANAVAGVGQAAVTGAVVGGGIGAAVGGLLSAGGAAADLIIDEKKFAESKGYTTDQFRYQLDNVKARPNTLGKVGAYNPNNKLFLFIERYHATDEEVTALKNHLYYGGMTVGRIGTIREFIGNNSGYTPSNETYRNFIKGKIIRIGVSEDAHLIKEILNEIDTGVYITPTEV